jgi:hypothetical protein
LDPRGLQVIDAEPADDGDQKCSGRSNIRSFLPPDKALLQHVLGVGDASEHAIGN